MAVHSQNRLAFCIKKYIYTRVEIINLGESNSILNRFVSELRDVNIQKDRLRFRRNIERIGEIMAYEISQRFTYSTKDIQSPLGIAPISTPDDKVVIGTILRAGLPFHQGFLNYMDQEEKCRTKGQRYGLLRSTTNWTNIPTSYPVWAM